jgi:hypothetical protein
MLSLHFVNAKQNMPPGQSSVLELGHRIEQDSLTSCQFLPQKYVFSGKDKPVDSTLETKVGSSVGCCVDGGAEVAESIGNGVGEVVGGLFLTVGKGFPPTGFLPPVGLGPDVVLLPVGMVG